ncbi:XRE family transcriptional regulator [Streptomyces sp. NPDC056105]|uniref:XRE family transcriptional regulator n=1 Tax=Streptomyces sp. NPDC056105 TaxID=3345714 RepID=UPI0035DC2E0A
MPKLLRKSEGQPLRTAMESAGLSGPDLAEATRRVDPDGKGVSPATVGRLAGQGKTARNACELKTAWVIAEALDEPLQRLFSMPTRSTVTVERSRSDAEEE